MSMKTPKHSKAIKTKTRTTEASHSSGPIARPVGEEATADAGSSNAPGEVTAAALANSIDAAPGFVQPRSGNTGEWDASMARDLDGAATGSVTGEADGAATSLPHVETKREIVRASGRIEVRLPTGEGRGEPGSRAAHAEAAKFLYNALYQARTLCAIAANAATMACFKADEQALADARAAGLELKVIKWPSRTLNLYKIAGDAATAEAVRRQWPFLATGVVADVSRAAGQKWSQTRWPVLVQLAQAPHWYRSDGSLPIRAQGFKVTKVTELDADGKAQPDLYRLHFSVHAGRHPNGHQFALDVEAHDNHRREMLKALVSGAWKVGQLRLDQDRRKRSRWYVRFAYTKEVHVPVARVVRYAGINRGIVTFLAGVIENDGAAARGTSQGGGGLTAPWLYDGARIVAMLKQIQRRRIEYQRDSRGQTSNRWGHGRNRTLAPIRKLEDYGARWRATTNQTLARAFVKWLVDHEVTHLRMEDLSGIRDSVPKGGSRTIAEPVRHLIEEWPYFDLGTRIKSCCEEAGIAIEVVPATLISQRCSACGHTARDNVQLADRKMICVSCGAKIHLDVNAARNVASGVTVKEEPPSGGAELQDGAAPKKETARKEVRKPVKKQQNAS